MASQTENIVAYRLYEISLVAHDVRQFKFRIPAGIEFKFLPGDHMKIYPDPKDTVEWRPYTPTTTPDVADHFELTIKRYPDGIVSRYMHDRRVDDMVWMSGPHEGGHFVEGMAKKVGMVAGGTGITPMISMIRYIIKHNLDVEVSLLFANKSMDDIILRDEFDKYAREHENFTRYYVLDKAPDGWTMGAGRIDSEMIKAHLPGPSEDTVIFVCGPPVMELDLQKKLRELGHSRKKIISP